MSVFNFSQIDKERCLSWRVDAPPCQAKCPLGINVEGYLSAIARGNFEDALAIIRERCILPSVCGRVCHHPCEEACKRSVVDEPLSIMALKRFAAEACLSHTQRTEPAERTRAEKVAIIGSGPAGLAAAHELVLMGFEVTVFEAMDVPGGMLAFGIPEFKLPQEIVQGEIEYIRSLGVDIKTGIRVGADITLQELRNNNYQAIIIATGAQNSLLLPIPGSDLKGVLPAMSFLRQAKLGDGENLSGHVVVIGGGNVAIDVARTALRLGAEEVKMFCLESLDDMPAFDEARSEAECEGVIIENSLAPQAFVSDDGKGVSRIILRPVTSFSRNSEGQIRFEVDDDPQNAVAWDVDSVIVAIGQVPEPLTADFSLGHTPRGTLVCDSITGTTNASDIFGVGDMVDNPGTVTESMASGRRVAASVVRFLNGEAPASPNEDVEPYTGSEIVPKGVTLASRHRMALIPPEEGLKGFQEVELGYTKEEAMEEAKRCLLCKSCNHCVKETECVAFSLMENGTKMSPYVQSLVCGGCGRCARACPNGNIHMTELE